MNRTTVVLFVAVLLAVLLAPALAFGQARPRPPAAGGGGDLTEPVTLSQVLTIGVGSGANAIKFSNVGARLSLGSNARYLYDNGVGFQLTAPLTLDSDLLVSGDIETGNLTVNGNLTIDSALEALSLTLSGAFEAASADITGELDVGGSISSGGDVVATGEVTGSNLSGTNTGDVTLGAVGASPNANGASFTGQALTLQPANGTHPGLLSAAHYTVLTNTTGTNSGNVTASAIGSSPNANGFTLTGQALNLQPADGSFGGVVTTGTQTFAGAKTFTGGVVSSTLTAGSGAALTFTSNAPDGTIAHVSNTTNTIGAGNYIAQWQSNGTLKMGLTGAGTLQGLTTLSIAGGHIQQGAGGGGLRISGNLSAASTGVSVRLVNNTIQTGATASIAGFYNDAAGTTPLLTIRKEGTLDFDSTDNSGSAGATTINKPAGRAAIAAAASSVVVTNSLVATTSTVIAVLQSNSDATCKNVLNVVPASGSFTINVNTTCTGNTAVGWFIADL